jgi:hypothetical protein
MDQIFAALVVPSELIRQAGRTGGEWKAAACDGKAAAVRVTTITSKYRKLLKRSFFFDTAGNASIFIKMFYIRLTNQLIWNDGSSSQKV